MKIALVSPLEEQVPPLKYGGTELVVSNIAETLVLKGHKVHLLATGDSQTEAHLHAVFPQAIRKEPHATDLGVRSSLKFIGVGKILDILDSLDVDIIHNHLGWSLIPFENQLSRPIITTLHGPLHTNHMQFILKMFLNHKYISISNSQREPLKNLNYISTVYNGIDSNSFDFSGARGNYLVFLGRMSPEKGPLQAIEVAKKFGMKLVMAAKIDIVDEKYYETQIKPHIDGKQIEYVGEVGPKEKNELLRNAYALLATIQWHEPFGLFMVEAMACGTPVIATNMGSAREIVEDGNTGFVVKNDINEFVYALKKIPSINRSDCRKRVEKLFTREIMTDNYLAVYESIIHKG